MRYVEETSTVTFTGQTTVPKAVRKVLGVDEGGKIVFRIEDDRVTVHNLEAEHRDPAVGAFLGLIEKDIAAGRHVRELPSGLVSVMRRAMQEVPADLNENLDTSVPARRTSGRGSIVDSVCRYMLTHPQASYETVATAFDVDREKIRYLVKYWRQITFFLQQRRKLDIPDDYPMFGDTRSKERLRVFNYMLAHPAAPAADVAVALGVTRGVVDFPVRHWKLITAFLAKEGMLRAR